MKIKENNTSHLAAHPILTQKQKKPKNKNTLDNKIKIFVCSYSLFL